MKPRKLSELRNKKGRSDKERLAKMTDEEKWRNAMNDPDCQPPTPEELKEFKKVHKETNDE